MVRHLRRAFKGAAVFKVGRDSRRPKGVVAYLGPDLRAPRAPLHHRVGVGLGQGVAGKLAGRAAVGLEQQRLWIAREARAVDVGMKVSLKVMMARHGVLLAALLVQANP